MIDVSVADGIRTIQMTNGPNAFNLDMVRALRDALVSAVDDGGGPTILTGDGKFFSTGLDLDWMMGDGAGDGARAMMHVLHEAMAQLLVFPGATVAVVNGHAFGAGAMLAACADYRVMNDERGFFCFPEVDLGLTMSTQFDGLLQAKYPSRILLDAWISGRKYTGPAAKRTGLVDHATNSDATIPAARKLLTEFVGKDAVTTGKLKAQLFAQAHAALLSETTAAPRSAGRRG